MDKGTLTLRSERRDPYDKNRNQKLSVLSDTDGMCDL